MATVRSISCTQISDTVEMGFWSLAQAETCSTAWVTVTANLAWVTRVRGRRGALAVRLELAASVATVSWNQIAIIALLTWIQDAVSACLVRRTNRADTCVAALGLACGRTTVA